MTSTAETREGKRSAWTNATCVCLFDSEGSGCKVSQVKYFDSGVFSEINLELPAGEGSLFYCLSQ